MAEKKAIGKDIVEPIKEQEDLPPDEKFAELQAQLDAEKAKNLLLQDQVDKRKGMLPGWIITTPLNPLYEGKTAGVRFTAGKGFIAGEDEKLAKYLCDDFGYGRRFVENYLEEPEVAKEVGSSLAELISPQIMR